MNIFFSTINELYLWGIAERFFLHDVNKKSFADIQVLGLDARDNEENIVYALLANETLNNMVHLVFDSFSVSETECDLCYENLLSYLNEMGYSYYSAYRWISISNFLIANGLFRAGLVCREKSKEAFLSMRLSRRITNHVAGIYFENADYNSAFDLLRNFWTLDVRINENRLLLSLFSGRTTPSFEHHDESFEKYISNRNCIIIGPAIDEKIQENHDAIIIRNNSPIDSEKPADYNRIVYYNGEAISRGIDIDIAAKKMGYLVVKQGYNIGSVLSANIHECCIFAGMPYVGTYNMLPLMIMDLWLHNVGHIYVTGNNLYLSKNPYSKEYRNSLDKMGRLRAFSVHNMFSQFCCLKNLFSAGVFDADEELTTILNMSPQQYALEMERIYLK